MQSFVTVELTLGNEFQLLAQKDMPALEARQWLDQQFVDLDCEPLRPSGKVLTADKVLAIAAHASQTHWSDTAWAQQFANATVAALARPVVKVDIPALAIKF
ncbi:hypothetical protein E8K88_13470 [Lampropedia aestuarii]|uniref:Uncharacterized protein n=1 Tax=Lampropedia aestuarii TaxID=2562762 RepID=A0A4V3YWQ0_9BURK|nr:hypothetical protein [Lampropedia aestuarii]MDH5858370.1 hypothetical protein [Lampropedia aestuarii]THJ32032.1 hypothetical protein E8K88_13470 [Lampropedia aestuarii]